MKKTDSKPEPPEGFPGPTYHNSKGLSGVQWKLRLQQVPLLLLSTPKAWVAPGRTSAPGEKKGAQKARASLSLRGTLSGLRNAPAISQAATPQGPRWLRGGGLSFMSLGVRKVCVCLFSTKPVLNWHKRNRFYK